MLDKEQRLSEGHSEAEDRKMDLEELTDDDEVALNLPDSTQIGRVSWSGTFWERGSETCGGPPFRGHR